MSWIKLILTIALTLIIWLFCDSPSLKLVGNAIVFGLMVAHLWVVIWNRAIFKLFKGDVYTYGMATLSINIFFLIQNLSVGFWLFHFYLGEITRFDDLPNLAWAWLFLSMVTSLLIPMLTTSTVDELPNINDRRQFEPPKFNQD